MGFGGGGGEILGVSSSKLDVYFNITLGNLTG
jgi:hypothetical protein